LRPAALFGVAVALAGAVAGIALADGNSIAVVDEGNVGAFSSIALDAEGRPVVSYDDYGSGGRLRILHCGDPVCGSGNTVVEPEPFVISGLHTSLVLDASSRPVVAYSGGGVDRSLRVLRCGDASCSSGNSIAVPEAGNTGYATSLALDAGGHPVVSYVDYENDDLKLLHCGDPTCTSANVITTPDAGDVGEFGTSLALDAAGHPVVAYCVVTEANCGELRILRCGDATCSTGNAIVTADASGDVGSYPSLALDIDGRPVVSYHDVTNLDLKVLRCGDASCSGGNTITAVDTVGSVGAFSSLELDAAGNPAISYIAGGQVKVLRCDDPACADGNVPALVDDVGTLGVRFGTSLALDAADLPAVSYLDFENGALRVARCADPACKAGTVPTPTATGTEVPPPTSTSTAIATQTPSLTPTSTALGPTATSTSTPDTPTATPAPELPPAGHGSDGAGTDLWLPFALIGGGLALALAGWYVRTSMHQ